MPWATPACSDAAPSSISSASIHRKTAPIREQRASGNDYAKTERAGRKLGHVLVMDAPGCTFSQQISTLEPICWRSSDPNAIYAMLLHIYCKIAYTASKTGAGIVLRCPRKHFSMRKAPRWIPIQPLNNRPCASSCAIISSGIAPPKSGSLHGQRKAADLSRHRRKLGPMACSRWAAPKFGGKDYTAVEQLILFEKPGKRTPFPLITLNSVAPSLMAFGTDEQNRISATKLPRQGYFCDWIFRNRARAPTSFSKPRLNSTAPG